MGLIDKYRVWKFRRLLNKIPGFVSRDKFEYCDVFLQKASLLFNDFPLRVRNEMPQLECLLSDMRKLVTHEFKNQLEMNLESNKKLYNVPKVVESHASIVKKVVPIKLNVRKKIRVKEKLLRPSKKVLALSKKIARWKLQGYNTSMLERQLRFLKKYG